MDFRRVSRQRDDGHMRAGSFTQTDFARHYKAILVRHLAVHQDPVENAVEIFFHGHAIVRNDRHPQPASAAQIVRKRTLANGQRSDKA